MEVIIIPKEKKSITKKFFLNVILVSLLLILYQYYKDFQTKEKNSIKNIVEQTQVIEPTNIKDNKKLIDKNKLNIVDEKSSLEEFTVEKPEIQTHEKIVNKIDKNNLKELSLEELKEIIKRDLDEVTKEVLQNIKNKEIKEEPKKILKEEKIEKQKKVEKVEREKLLKSFNGENKDVLKDIAKKDTQDRIIAITTSNRTIGTQYTHIISHNGSFVNVRENPTTKSKILLKMKAGTKINCLNKKRRWCKIDYGEGFGFIWDGLLTEIF